MDCRRRSAISSGTIVGIALVLVVSMVAVGYFSVVPGGQISDLQKQLSSLQSQNTSFQKNLTSFQSNESSQLSNLGQKVSSLQQSLGSLPVMNQTTTVRTIWETWYLSPSAHQDRFSPAFITVNQGDTIRLTLIDNDTVAHTFTMGPPYSINVNATVPGLINDLTGQTFTTPSENNSPGVVVTGTMGNVTAKYSFVAKYAGVYEFVCTYHAQVGMIGYLAVLPNLSYETRLPAGHPSPGKLGANVTIVPGAGSNTSLRGYSLDVTHVVIGVNNTVTWTNNDNAPHTVNANDGSFESGNIAPGSSFTFTFTKAGVYKYHCVYHPWMTGTVIVTGG